MPESFYSKGKSPLPPKLPFTPQFITITNSPAHAASTSAPKLPISQGGFPGNFKFSIKPIAPLVKPSAKAPCGTAVKALPLGAKPLLKSEKLFKAQFSKPLVPAQTAPRELACPHCGLTQNLLKRHGLVGCRHCYAAFAGLLMPVLKQLQHAGVHAGKRPGKLAPRIDVRRRIQILEMAIEQAIQKEAYEAAAVCRDRIKELMGR